MRPHIIIIPSTVSSNYWLDMKVKWKSESNLWVSDGNFPHYTHNLAERYLNLHKIKFVYNIMSFIWCLEESGKCFNIAYGCFNDIFWLVQGCFVLHGCSNVGFRMIVLKCVKKCQKRKLVLVRIVNFNQQDFFINFVIKLLPW